MAETNQTENTAPVSDAPQQGIVAKTREYLQQKDGGGSSTPTVATDSPSAQTQSQPSKNVSVKGMNNLADAMFAKGMITEDQLRSVKFEAVTNNTSPAQVMISKGMATEVEVQQIRAEMFGLAFIDLDSITIPSEVLNKIPQDLARKNMAVVFEETSNRVKVAMIDPLDLQRVKFLESMMGKRLDAYYATQTSIQSVIDTKYGAQIGNVVDRALEDIGVVSIKENDLSGELDQNSIEGAPVAKIVNMILDYAIKHGASDIHIEPRDNRLAVRFRVYGILSEKLTLPSKLANSVVARIKIMSDMKIDEHRVPQDNRFQVKVKEGSAIDVRVSVMPSVHGEKVVMRLLRKTQDLVDINKIGLRGPGLKLYKHALSKTQGIILITGPTGSGKTVTLASSLGVLNTQDVNILTLEDPVEIRIDGITQVQVNPDVGLTFASGLRAFLRQDPDVIMVGEIRDGETANLAVQAALTGHLVLATLHTNSAAGAITRLMDLGVPPYLLSSTINVVVGQRLVRQLCPDSREAYHPDAEVLKMMHSELDKLNGFDLKLKGSEQKIHFDAQTEDVTLYKAVSTPNCDTGYSGRMGIFEVMPISDKISRMVMENASAKNIQDQAVAEGMITMVQDGFMKAMEGVTTLEEVLRVQTV